MFSVGDFVEYRGDNCGRVDGIFVFNVYGIKHMFVLITPIQNTYEPDPALGVDTYVVCSDQQLVVGLPAIEPVCPVVYELNGRLVRHPWHLRIL